MDFYTSVILHKSNILVCGYKDGKRYKKKVSYQPYLFTPAKANESTGFKTIDGKNVTKRTFSSIWEAKKFYYDYENVDGFTIWIEAMLLGVDTPQFSCVGKIMSLLLPDIN